MIFFFIGAPLGAIIRKGGLGVPVIVSIFVFILYYMLDNTGYRMARGGMWTIGFGKGLAPAVLIPLAAFVTYKAQNDSYVFNIDIWRSVMMRMLGLRLKRHISGKEVIINDPLYAKDVETLLHINRDLVDYSHTHNLRLAPNVIKIFFKYLPDHNIESLNVELEKVIEDLSNTRDKVIMHELNNYPILAVKAHTRPFEHRWMNTTAAIIVPVGIFFYIRMWIFRLRMYNDLRTIKATDDAIIERINDHILKKDI
jgi:lipopolysaccharide export system permease protein